MGWIGCIADQHSWWVRPTANGAPFLGCTGWMWVVGGLSKEIDWRQGRYGRPCRWVSDFEDQSRIRIQKVWRRWSDLRFGGSSWDVQIWEERLSEFWVLGEGDGSVRDMRKRDFFLRSISFSEHQEYWVISITFFFFWFYCFECLFFFFF